MIEFIDSHLKAGHIRPSSSYIAVGMFMVPKDEPDGIVMEIGQWAAVAEFCGF